MEATELEEMQQDQICFCCFSMLGADLHRHLCPSFACAGSYFLCQYYMLLESKAGINCKFSCAHQQKLAFNVNEEYIRHNYIKNREMAKAIRHSKYLTALK